MYTGPDENPTTWLWTSGQELMHTGDVWEINATTPNFSGEVCVNLIAVDRCLVPLMDLDGVALANSSVGRLRINAADGPTTETSSPWTEFTSWNGAHYTLTYRLLAAAPAQVNQPNADPQLEPDLGMLRNGSPQPLERRLLAIKVDVADTARFQNKVLQLSRLCREAVKRYEKERLERYLKTTTDNDQQKTATATRLARDVARMEFLLGWMYYRGYNARLASAHPRTTSRRNLVRNAG